MQMLAASARNHRLLYDEPNQTFMSEIEMVLTTFDLSRKVVGEDLASVAKIKTTRIAITPEHARTFAAELVAWADEADALREQVTPKAQQ